MLCDLAHKQDLLGNTHSLPEQFRVLAVTLLQTEVTALQV